MQAWLVVGHENKGYCRMKHRDKDIAEGSRGTGKIKSFSKLQKGDMELWIQREEAN